MLQTHPADNLIPAKDKWEFDQQVTAVFEDMLHNSIPGYLDMRSLVTRIGRKFIPENGVVIDIGASRGDALAGFIGIEPNCNYYAVEVSEPMREVMQARFHSDPAIHPSTVTICDHDLRTNHQVFGVKSDLILSVLTLMFIPIEHRQRLVQSMYDSLKPGGALILVEKMLGANSVLNDLLVDAYYSMKRDNGYTQEAITRKKLSLEGVLVPVPQAWNEDMLRQAGFKHIDLFWRSLNFGGFIAIK